MENTAMATLKELIQERNVRATSEYGAPENSEFTQSHGYTVTLKYQRRQMTTPFYMGYAHTDEPTALDVLECLLSDSDVEDYEFEEWASNLGYDPDSRRAERIYKTATRQTKKLHQFLGEDYELFLASLREE
jgi:hypothetical protein